MYVALTLSLWVFWGGQAGPENNEMMKELDSAMMYAFRYGLPAEERLHHERLQL